MEKHNSGGPGSFPGNSRTVFCIWFLGGMSLSMLLSGLYTLMGMSLPSGLLFLFALVYLAGGIWGGMWSRTSLCRKPLSLAEKMIILFLFLLSIGFLILGSLFVILGFQHR